MPELNAVSGKDKKFPIMKIKKERRHCFNMQINNDLHEIDKRKGGWISEGKKNFNA